MIEKDILDALQVLRRRGMTQREIAHTLGVSRTTVQKYWDAQPGQYPKAIHRTRPGKLAAHQGLVEELYRQHRNCDVVRQELAKRGIEAGLRMIERYTEAIRQETAQDARAIQRIETPPGMFMQIDYGTRKVVVGGVKQKVKFFVAELAYSRRVFVTVTPGERRVDWINGIEAAFRHFNGLPEAIICDNAKPLVYKAASRDSRECELDDVFLDFCRYWNVQPIACYAKYPEAKGKVERIVGYVKSNAIAGHTFATFEELEQHLLWWMDTVADLRDIKRLSAGEPSRPAERFVVEHQHLQGYVAKPHFNAIREELRKVGAKGLIEVDGRSYQLPLVLVGKTVQIRIADEKISVYHDGELKMELHKALGAFKPTTTSGMDEDGKPTFGTTDPRYYRRDRGSGSSFQRSLDVYQEMFELCTQEAQA